MEFKHYRGKIRRFYLSHFRKDYIEDQLKRRKGICNMCGRCCQLGYRCIYLTDDNVCSVYQRHRWLRPVQCAAFPIDSKDMGEMDNPQCGFYFEN